MRKFVISIVTLAAPLAFASISSAINMFSQPLFAAQKATADLPSPGDYSIDFESFLTQLPSR
jgi:ABC-type Na+ efflux pump permease subunit